MSGSGRRFLLPVIGRHVAVEFLRAFALTVLAFLAIYVLADFFDRFDSFLQHDARAGTIIRLFLYRIPLIVTQVTPVAVLAGGLVGLGLLARQNEFVAMRACGVSIWQILLPLSLVAVVLSILIFAWNETVVPASARRWHQIWNEEIKGKQADGKPYAGELVEFHRKFAIPFACVVFGLVGVPLGIGQARAVKSRGFAVSLCVIFVYYILLSTGQGFAEQGRIPAWIGLWLPNVVFGLLGIFLVRRAGRERALFGTWLTDLAAQLRESMSLRRGAGVSP